MATGTIVSALVILVGLSVNYATTDALEWPEECEKKNYCRIKPNSSTPYPNDSQINLILNRDMFKPTSVPTDVGNRQGDVINDVAKCDVQRSYVEPIYAIKDENDIVWYVPQTVNFTVNVETYECTKPARVTGNSQTGLKSNRLLQKKVHCIEQRVAFKFPVLSQDLTKLEMELKSPKGGLPLSCSAKILK